MATVTDPQTDSRSRAVPLGVLLSLAGALGFSTKAILVKLAYALDPAIDTAAVMAFRMGFALPLFVAAGVWFGRRGPVPARHLPAVAALGLMGYYVSTYLDLKGLETISAGLERLILFVYPTLVVLLVALRERRPLAAPTLFALGASYLGVALAVGGEVAGGGADRLLGGALVLGAAFTFALFNLGAGEMIRRHGAGPFTAVAMAAASVAALLHYGVVHGATRPPMADDAWLPFLAICLTMAVVATVLPAFLISYGIARIGAGKSAVVGTIGPVATIAMAAALLNEPVTPMQIVGGACVLVGVTAISLRRSRS